jgi:phage terminase large subunit-like protein
LTTSPASSLASLPAGERRRLLAAYTPAELEALRYDWRFWARPAQLPPPDPWRVWVILAGRGFGKTRSGAEWVQGKAAALPGSHGALVAKVPADARDVMIEGGESSLLKVAPPWFRPGYEPSKRRLTWPNGTWATVYSSKEFETLRGPQHHWAWADEFCAWHYPQETWDMLMMGLRLGENPQALITTTPKPLAAFRRILQARGTVVTGGSTYENRANLADAWFDQIINRYEGTTLGQQELHAALLDEMPGAYWTRALLERTRVPEVDVAQLVRVVVAIDPATTSEEDSNETGLVAAGVDRRGHGYLLEDASGIYTPIQWARRAVQLVDRWGADRVVAETNQGGEMVEQTLRTVRNTLPYRGVRASRAKEARAEPVAALYEQGVVHHVGAFPGLEDQLCTWTPGLDSPDRLDALVWAFTDLLLGTQIVPATPAGELRASGWRDG